MVQSIEVSAFCADCATLIFDHICELYESISAMPATITGPQLPDRGSLSGLK
jgi:hypothetical protein